MKCVETSISGLMVIEGAISEDDRGFSTKSFSREEFSKMGVDVVWDQTLYVSNRKKATLRGMHWQAHPYPETKLVQCVKGSVFDVVVDMRNESPTFGQSYDLELSADSATMLLVPDGLAHGYLTLEDESALLYHIAGEYLPDAQRVFRWDDETVAIDWPMEPELISTRDANAPYYSEKFDSLQGE